MFDVWRIFKIWTQYLKHSYQFCAFMTDEKEFSLVNNFTKIEHQKGQHAIVNKKSQTLHTCFFPFKSNQKPLFIHITSFYGLSDAWVKDNLNWENWFIFFLRVSETFGKVPAKNRVRLTDGKMTWKIWTNIKLDTTKCFVIFFRNAPKTNFSSKISEFFFPLTSDHL